MAKRKGQDNGEEDEQLKTQRIAEKKRAKKEKKKAKKAGEAESITTAADNNLPKDLTYGFMSEAKLLSMSDIELAAHFEATKVRRCEVETKMLEEQTRSEIFNRKVAEKTVALERLVEQNKEREQKAPREKDLELVSGLLEVLEAYHGKGIAEQ